MGQVTRQPQFRVLTHIVMPVSLPHSGSPHWSDRRSYSYLCLEPHLYSSKSSTAPKAAHSRGRGNNRRTWGNQSSVWSHSYRCRYPYPGKIHKKLVEVLEDGNMTKNKANLRDLIAATGLVILLKLDFNHSFFILHDLEIRWMTSKNNRAPLLVYIKLCALFQSH